MATAGDPISPALESVLIRFTRLVAWVGRKYGLDPADIDEMTQDLRIRLWRARETGESIAGSPSSYVYRTARSAALDLVRRRRSTRVEPATVPAGGMEGGPATGPNRDLEQSELAERIHRAVAQLDEPRRQAVRLRLLGYESAEIARMMGWSGAKTRNLLYRGLADLREALADQGIGPEGMQ
jgi:RNA polymerase sigma-70 factor (ECF subfamily)